MVNEIISYLEMCQREGSSLQRGMNFSMGGNHSVILMSVRPNAPYEDELVSVAEGVFRGFGRFGQARFTGRASYGTVG